MKNTIKTITCIAAIGLAMLAKAEVYTFETFKADFGSIPSVKNHSPVTLGPGTNTITTYAADCYTTVGFLTVAISETSIDRTVSLPRQVELSLQRQNKRASGAITYSTVNGYESADYSFLDTINGASYYVMHRIIVVNKRTYYSLMAVVAAEAGPNAATQERDRFFNSFSFGTK